MLNLSNIGLTEKEQYLYELLLRLGEIDATRLIEESGLKRPTVYKCVYSLIAKGLVTQRDIKKIIHFKPESPERLLDLTERQYEQLSRTRDDLRNILPDLTSSYLLSVERPVVTTFEGVKGLKKIYEDTLREGKEILALLKVVEVNDELGDWLMGDYVKRRTSLGIKAKVIVSSSSASHRYVLQSNSENRETRVVDYDVFPFEHEVNIYGDKLAFIDYSKNSKLIGVVINHPLIAKTARGWFELAWLGAGVSN